ncbi:Sortase A, LPXTG specific [Lachnospiraceae bacterium TWA4]|nr:Sortase A, LPXTG specific [Lachnospiraceae bacterium TWA4]
MKKRKISISTIISILVFLVGLSLLLYPTISNYWNSFHQSRAIKEYTAKVAELDRSEYERILSSAKKYNENLIKNPIYTMSDSQKIDYESQLNVSGDGIMGYIDIPSINCSLPIYHGMDEAILQVAVGHIDWTSLPVGGKGTHCALSGHRGLPSAKLFTDLDRLVIGDIFQITVLDEILTYQVDQIVIVEPNDSTELEPQKDKDYCTLVTCTPYGINSHRLLIRGERTDNPKDTKTGIVASTAEKIEPIIIAPIIAAVILVILFIVILIRDRRERKKRKKS